MESINELLHTGILVNDPSNVELDAEGGEVVLDTQVDQLSGIVDHMFNSLAKEWMLRDAVEKLHILGTGREIHRIEVEVVVA